LADESHWQVLIGRFSSETVRILIF